MGNEATVIRGPVAPWLPERGGGARLAVVVLIAASLFSGRDTLAYNVDGHFYSSAAVLNGFIPRLEASQRQYGEVIALCTQMPDLASELDAVSLRVRLLDDWGGWVWGPFGVCATAAVDDMDQKHHYLHALTDQAADKVQDAARQTLELLRNRFRNEPDDVNACALGFGIHALGDSFAHVRLGTFPPNERMYAPGMGHYKDNHNPDYIVFSPERERRWERYTRLLADTMQVHWSEQYSIAMWKIARAELATGDGSNTFYTDESRMRFHADNIRLRLAAMIEAAPGPTWQSWRTPLIENVYQEGDILLKPFDLVVHQLMPDRARNMPLILVWHAYLESVRVGWKAVPPACHGAAP